MSQQAFQSVGERTGDNRMRVGVSYGFVKETDDSTICGVGMIDREPVGVTAVEDLPRVSGLLKQRRILRDITKGTSVLQVFQSSDAEPPL